VATASSLRIDILEHEPFDKNDACFLEHLNALKEELLVPGAIRAACIHEAGHILYFRVLAATLGCAGDKIQFVRPYVSYGRNRDTFQLEFDHAIAATSTSFEADAFDDYPDATLLGLAKASFAGGVFVEEIAGTEWRRGDNDDARKFHRHYNDAIRVRGTLDILESDFKTEAIKEVTKDVQKETIRSGVLILANQFENVCRS
jgi:hypothetical protein